VSLNNPKIKFFPVPNQFENSKMHIGAGELYSILRRNLLSIVFFVLIGLLVGTFYAFYLPNVYTVDAKLVLEPSDSELFEAVPEIAEQNLNNETIATELEVISSRYLVGRVVDALGLVNNPDFNPYLRERLYQENHSETSATLIGRLGDLLGYFSSSEANDPSNKVGRVGRLLTAEEQRERTITHLITKIQVDRIDRSMAINIRASSSDPVLAVETANTFADEYLKLSTESRRESTEKAIAFLTQRSDDLGEEVSELEQLMVEHIIQYRLSDEQLGDTLRGEIEALKVQLQIALNNRNESNFVSAETIESEMRAKQAMLSERHTAQIKLRQLERDIASRQERYQQIIKRLGNLHLQAEPLNPHGNILSYAQLPTQPSSPKRFLIITACVVVGAVLALLFTVLRESLDNRIRSEDDVARITGIPIFGMIPEIKQKRWDTQLLPHEYLLTKPFSHYADAIHQITTGCRSILASGDPSTILLTSCIQDEGKTSTALSVAFSSALEGRKTVLLDADFHHCSASSIAGIPEYVRSLDEVIAGKCSLEEAIYHYPDQPFLDVIGFPELPKNAEKLLSKEAMEKVLSDLKERYQLIVVDTPPVLLASSSTFMAKFADLVIVVVRWGKMDTKTLSHILRRLQLFAAVPLGIAIGRVDFNRQARLHYDHSAKYQAHANNYYYN